ncbi:hypothetical protein LCGC14_1266350 [marine sediment metagenome]|uniref:Uncharacterized protein n=1 Tax=marine sediment metagenome TaxID=412755 RepID=A0A0F9P2J8_9ZZZZ
MGYYTRFNLKVIGKTDINIIDEFRNKCDYAEVALDEDGNADEECKWYDCREDVQEFSKRYPDVLFLLEGKGEDVPDEWRFYARNGKGCLQKSKDAF